MRAKKVILTITTAVAIVAPLVPKTVNVNITMQEQIKSAKPYTRVKTTCELFESIQDSGRQVCKYKCRDGDNYVITKVHFNSGAICTKNIEETVKKTQR